MAAAKITGSVLPFTLCFWAMLAGPASAARIVGITFARGFYDVDALTGNTTLLFPGCPPPGCGPYIGASAGPDTNSILVESIVNVYEVNLAGPQFLGFTGYSSLDLAFDRATNTIYETDGKALSILHCAIPFMPSFCFPSEIGPGFPTNGMQALDFVPGVGLYGVGDNNLYFINASSGVATLIGFTGLFTDPLANTNVTDLAYDGDTGRLIASVGCQKQLGLVGLVSGGPCDESIPGSIYSIDRFTGHATLLNGKAPQLMGLAEVVVPEPGSGLPVAAGLGALLVWCGLPKSCTNRSVATRRVRSISPAVDVAMHGIAVMSAAAKVPTHRQLGENA